MGMRRTLYILSSHNLQKVCLFLLRIIKDTGSNTIQILLSNTAHLTSTIFALLGNLHVLKLQKCRSDDTSIRLTEMLTADSIAVVSSIPLPQGTDSKSRTEVDLACDTGRANVVPVLAVRGKFVGNRGLDKIGPDGEFELVRVLQVLGVGGDEGLGGDVADADSSCFFSHGCGWG